MNPENDGRSSGESTVPAPLRTRYLVAPLLALSGCEHAPAFNLLGSYFPSWILCFAAGVLVTLLAHACFSRINFTRQLWPLPIVYPALTCLVAFGTWLVLFR